MEKLEQQIKRFITKNFEIDTSAINEEIAIKIINDLEKKEITSFSISLSKMDGECWLEAYTAINIDDKYYRIIFNSAVKLDNTLENLIINIVNLEYEARAIARKLETEKDPMWKSFEVKSICREDLKDYLTKKQIAQLDDDDMKYLADKLGDALQDDYWTSLEVIIDDRIKPELAEKNKK